jgi:hypothetical protein
MTLRFAQSTPLPFEGWLPKPRAIGPSDGSDVDLQPAMPDGDATC